MDAVQWWCSAVDLPWTWEWRAYPGVWLFIGLFAFGYWRVTRLASNPPEAERGWRRAAGAGGILALWIAFDWPVGALGGGYLRSGLYSRERGLFVILLTNRVNPTDSNQRHVPLRRDVADAVQRAVLDAPLVDWEGQR